MNVEVFIASKADAALFGRIAHDVFDNPVRPDMLSAFLADERHHIALATFDSEIIGFVSAVDYLHPDKPRELWINEVGVAPAWQRHGIARRLLRRMLDHGSMIGCREAWVLTEPDNVAALALYRSVAGAADEAAASVMLQSFRLTPDLSAI